MKGPTAFLNSLGKVLFPQLSRKNNVRDENKLVAFDLFSLFLLFPFLVHLEAGQVSVGLW